MHLPDLTVDDVAAGGDGIARADDGRVVFVRGGVPGDRVAAEVVRERRRRLHAVATHVHAPSRDRADPPCPHVAEGCGGCGWQHLTPTAQRRWKQRIAEESLRRIGGLPGTVTIGPPLPTTGFRTTLRCLVTERGLAFRGARSYDPVPVTGCLVAHPALDQLVVAASSGELRLGGARELTLRVGGATGERLVVVEPQVPPGSKLPADVQVVGADELRAGRRASFHDVVEGHRFRISARSFFQTRTDGARALVDAVRRAGDDAWGRGRLVDLYGGVGLFARTLGEGMGVTLVEASRSSVADARHNLGDLDARVVHRRVETWSPGDANGADIVVADPPRTGLGAAGVSVVGMVEPERLVLVSCDAASFGRDTRLLVEAGYARRSTQLVDLFPHTPHVELVSRFDRVRASPM